MFEKISHIIHLMLGIVSTKILAGDNIGNYETISITLSKAVILTSNMVNLVINETSRLKVGYLVVEKE